ncbi:MAG: UDP-glucose--hexose-1-phosphate uridylyltransferase [Bryobacterales bacterium]|nr:UDP-glucose--hexose-1-phosphate uridylyltransferase [Bryobacterales bacterium]MBV9397038.1 UDP-glucose--hexose-1-phosphate uridylyltransferase [Bryobacterales bacterium]
MDDWLQRPHRRLNPLTGEWVLVSPQRATRPWQGLVEAPAQEQALPYDPTCYLCPGNARAGGMRNPAYNSTFVFDNDFPALVPQGPERARDEQGLFVAQAERGICRVVCFSPRHDLTVSQMDEPALECVVETWRQQASDLEQMDWIRYVQIFENRGALMGASNPHPHCQIWASEHIPNEIAKELEGQQRYLREKGACLLCAYSSAERGRDRIVCSNSSFTALVPFWAIWPFEILIVSTRHMSSLQELSGVERNHLAALLRAVTRQYDALFAAPFPYSMGFHPAPARHSRDAAWHFHAHFYPPLLRSATIRKFMVGYELLANPQRDVTPEVAAELLRSARA